jgi:enamine deaminase RidA (YjgF/YER057c/UK114 family)
MLKFSFQSADTLSSQTTAISPEILGTFCFAQQLSPAALNPADPTHQHVAMRVLGKNTVLYERLDASRPIQSGQCNGVRYRYNNSILFGIVALDEAEFSTTGTTSPLQATTQAAYERIFLILKKEEFSYPLRFWNYMSDINGISHDLERYRQFNLGRQQAFDAAKHDCTNNLSAACALGAASGPLIVAFLAGRAPSLPIENPRQISAYEYPAQYGPRSPLFSRASVAQVADTRMLFLSGTASIVGHATLHAGDVTAQTEESLRNIAAVLEEVRNKTGASCEPDDLHYIVYIRHAADYSSVRNTLERRIGPNLKAFYVQADICRSDLLVEIEGAAELSPL